MSGEEKHNLKSYFWKLQAFYYILTILAMLGIVKWISGEFKDIHYAAKQTPVIEIRQYKTDSTVAANQKLQVKFMNLTAHKIDLNLKEIYREVEQ